MRTFVYKEHNVVICKTELTTYDFVYRLDLSSDPSRKYISKFSGIDMFSSRWTTNNYSYVSFRVIYELLLQDEHDF
jgi:hypothetical protein